MFPSILDGDVLTIAPLNGIKPSVGDVVAFVSPRSGHLVVHRVVASSRVSYLIRGDSDAPMGETVPLDQVLGRAISVERQGDVVRFGLGPERRALGILSRLGLLLPVLKRVGPVRRLFS